MNRLVEKQFVEQSKWRGLYPKIGVQVPETCGNGWIHIESESDNGVTVAAKCGTKRQMKENEMRVSEQNQDSNKEKGSEAKEDMLMKCYIVKKTNEIRNLYLTRLETVSFTRAIWHKMVQARGTQYLKWHKKTQSFSLFCIWGASLKLQLIGRHTQNRSRVHLDTPNHQHPLIHQQAAEIMSAKVTLQFREIMKGVMK